MASFRDIRLPFDEDKLTKLYYTITEVGALLEIKPSTIRFWEIDFPIIRPPSNSKGERRYRLNDIKKVYAIKILIVDKGKSHHSAKQELKGSNTIQEEKDVLLAKLKYIKSELLKWKT